MCYFYLSSYTTHSTTHQNIENIKFLLVWHIRFVCMSDVDVDAVDDDGMDKGLM